MDQPICTTDEFGTIRYLVNSEYHRVDGPARIWSGGREWWQNGKRHRTDGPAYIGSLGTEYWYQNGKLHRTDGPAVIRLDGREEFWLDDKKVDIMVHFLQRK